MLQNLKRHLLGFDSMFDVMESLLNKTPDTYPRYNIGRVENNDTVIEIGVAGFRQENVEVTLTDGGSNSLLTIHAKMHERQENEKRLSPYHYQGLAKRNFSLRFLVPNGSEVKDCVLEYGILKIVVSNPPEQEPKRIEVRSASSSVPLLTS